MFKQLEEISVSHLDIQAVEIENSLLESPFYVALSNYSPKTPRAPARDSTTAFVTPPRRRPSSPLRPINENPPGPAYNYSFPSPRSQATSMPSPTSINPLSLPGPALVAQHRVSVSGRSRRPSQLLHEIQPPSRRLSAHQMLLLTPFGGSVPAGALSGGSGMARGSSSTGSAMGPLPTAPARLGSGTDRSSGWPRKDSGHSIGMSAGPSSSSMGREMSTSSQRIAPRMRHSLAHPSSHGYGASVGPSPLASAPMTTIHSNSETGSSEGASSREASRNGRERNNTFMSRAEAGSAMGDASAGLFISQQPQEARAIPRLLPSTVAMTRSNSLPVLTLRELEAMKEKDGELGIQRGGDWAWVSSESTDESGVDAEQHDAPGTSASQTTTPQPNTIRQAVPLSRQPFTNFQDPFAPVQVPGQEPIQQNDPILDTEIIIPASTSSDYHYSPTWQEPRRMSEAPINPDKLSEPRARASIDTRRPSAPAIRGSLGGMTPRASVSAASGISGTSNLPTVKVGEISPGGTPLEPIPSRPRITRYKTSPARYTGLGLNIVVRPTNAENGGNVPPFAGPSSAGSFNESRLTSGERSHPGSRTSSIALGSWAEVDIVDPLTAARDVMTVSATGRSSVSPSTRRSRGTSTGSISVTGRSSRRSSGRVSVASVVSAPPAAVPGFTIEHVASRSHLSGFETTSPTFTGRSRFESVDSAFPLMPGGSGGRLSVPHIGAGEGYRTTAAVMAGHDLDSDFGPSKGIADHDGFPRRSSLGVSTFTKLRRAMSPWVKEGVAQEVGVAAGAYGGVDMHTGFGEAEDKSRRSRHWSERRGSWAESWTKVR